MDFFLMLGVCRPSWSQDCVGEKIKTRSILRKGKDQEIEVCVVKHQSNLREVVQQLETDKQACGQSLECIYLNFHVLQSKDIAVTT